MSTLGEHRLTVEILREAKPYALSAIGEAIAVQEAVLQRAEAQLERVSTERAATSAVQRRGQARAKLASLKSLQTELRTWRP